MKFKQKNSSKITLSEKIADALTVKPRADIEDDQVFGTKPHTVSRAEFSSSESEDETAISDFRKQNVNLLSDISKKYEGKVVSRKDLDAELDKESDASDLDEEENADKNGNIESSEDSESMEMVKKFKELTKQTDSEPDDSDDEDSIKEKLQSAKKSMQQSGSDTEDSEDGESDDYSITQFKKQLENDDESDKSGEESDNDEDDGEGVDISELAEPLKEDFEHVKKQNVSEEVKKGACVRNQLLVWEGLLEMRIHLQRCMNTANQMPLPDTHEQLKQDSQFDEACNRTKANITNTLDKLLTLQNLLLRNFPETKALSSSKKSSESLQKAKDESDEEIPSDTDNEEIPSDTEDEDTEEKEKAIKINVDDGCNKVKKRKLEDFENDISKSHKAFKSFRDTTIQKWNDKTQLASASNVKNAPKNTVLHQISFILSDREKLVRRTQLKRSEYDIVGYSKPVEEVVSQNGDANVNRDRKDDDEYITEIFDDSDFYHQLLRELIECKSADISDPVQLSRQWIALQQMRSKMKRKVDTKATKGRKIKYVVHNQLVNFMAPENSTVWNEESTNELYSSLFGKMFEQNSVGVSDSQGAFKIKN